MVHFGFWVIVLQYPFHKFRKFWFVVISSCISFSKFAGDVSSLDSGSLRKLAGKYVKYFRAKSTASCSSSTSTSPQPETEQCIFAPPISSRLTFSPITISAIRGEPKYMDALPSTITPTSQNAGIYAPPADEGPNKRQICGICPDIFI